MRNRSIGNGRLSRRRGLRPLLERVENRCLLATFTVTNTADAGAGSLRNAILQANAIPGADNIHFDIKASDRLTSPLLDVPVPGFDPITQTWLIKPLTPLPTITDQLTIDGYTQAHAPQLYRYPQQISQAVLVDESVTGGKFTLTTTAPLPGNPVRTTDPIDYDADPATILAALNQIVGIGNVFVSGGPVNVAPVVIKFIGSYADQGLGTPTLTADGSNLENGSVSVTKTGERPVEITSIANTIPALNGNDARVRVIVDGSLIDRTLFPDATGFVIDASHSTIRGLAIDRFEIGVEIPSRDNVGNRIQGNFIGGYYVFPVDPATGQRIEGPGSVKLKGKGNKREGIRLGSTNAAVGGTVPQENNVITRNGAQGIHILPGAEGNQILGNQIGIAGPTINGRFVIAGNGEDGVWIESSSSNAVGGATPGSGNLISGNGGHGIWITGPVSNLNRVEGNYIGAPPGGDFLFGAGDPGNIGDGVRIENAPENRIGGAEDLQRNVIAANEGAGVRILGDSAIGNVILNNRIGIEASGRAVLGNSQEGVAIFSRDNVVGPNNVISGNLRGVRLSGPGARNNLVRDNFLGTDIDGLADLGNAREGVRIDAGATGNRILGNSNGSQLISGNDVGVAIVGASTTSNTVAGNFIGTDVTGSGHLNNSNQGVLIDGAPGNTIGGTTGNRIISNHWGVVITGATATDNIVRANVISESEVHGLVIQNRANANIIGGTTSGAGNTITLSAIDGIVLTGVGTTGNVVAGNLVGTNLSGADQGNVGQGIRVSAGASDNTIGGTVALAANTIAFNTNGVVIEGPGTTDNRIQGNLIGVDAFGERKPNRANGVLIRNNASYNVIGEASANAGNTIAFNGTEGVGGTAGVLVQSGIGIKILSNSIYDNVGDLGEKKDRAPGIVLAPGANNDQPAPVLSLALATDALTRIEGTLQAAPNTAYTIQFFGNPVGTTDPIAGREFLGQTTVTTNGAGTATIVFESGPGLLFAGEFVTATATDPAGNTSEFSAAEVVVSTSTGRDPVFVTTTADVIDPNDGELSLREAILAANARPGPDTILFDLPVEQVNLSDRNWTIVVNPSLGPLPTITDQVSIAGYSQPAVSVTPAGTNETQQVRAPQNAAGLFRLIFTDPRDGSVQRTGFIPVDAFAFQVQEALEALQGIEPGDVSVISPTLTNSPWNITFLGNLGQRDIPLLRVDDSTVSGGRVTVVSLTDVTVQPVPNTVETPGAGSAANNARLVVVVDGSLAGGTGLTIAADNTDISGLRIQNFAVGIDVLSTASGTEIAGNFVFNNSRVGVRVQGPNNSVGIAAVGGGNVFSGNGIGVEVVGPGATGNLIQGNFLGATTIIGPVVQNQVVPGNTGDGLVIRSSSNLVGGLQPNAGNTISGNGGAGIRLVGQAATRNVIQANLIGTDPTGVTSLRFELDENGNRIPFDWGNDAGGIVVENAPSNQIGGTAEDAGNVIGGSTQAAGLRISGPGATRNVVEGNLIGVNIVDNLVANLGNLDGVRIENAAGNRIGGTIEEARNVIALNDRHGIHLLGGGATGNLIQGNFIGTVNGGDDFGNTQDGIRIENAPVNLIGGAPEGATNVISGNNVGVHILGAGASGNVLQNNLIGTDSGGTAGLPNARQGVWIEDAPNNTIGGTFAQARNVISANHWGVEISGAGATGNAIQGNFIGTDISGTAPLPNELDGVLIRAGASGNTVGGTTTAAGNVIAFNERDGVRLEGDSVRNAILTNSIVSNVGLGIRLDPTGGARPNNLQPAPVLTSIATDPTSTRIEGKLTSAPGVYTVQFFANSALDPSGSGEGETYIGETTVTVGAGGVATFEVTLPLVLPSGQFVTATATDALGNTSEFSNGRTEDVSAVQFSQSVYIVAQGDGVATIEVTRTGSVAGTVTVAYATMDGTAIAGIDYVPTSGVLVFGPGERVQSFTVTILNGVPGSGDKAVVLTLSDPTGGAILGTPAIAQLTLADIDGPRVVDVQPVRGRHGITAIVITFDKALEPSTAVDLRNYGYSVRSIGRDHRIGTRDDQLIGLRSAVYDPATLTVTLTTEWPIHPNWPILVTINETTSVPGAGVGVADLDGNLLDGNGDGRPGSPFAQVINERPQPVRRPFPSRPTFPSWPGRPTPIPRFTWPTRPAAAARFRSLPSGPMGETLR